MIFRILYHLSFSIYKNPLSRLMVLSICGEVVFKENTLKDNGEFGFRIFLYVLSS